MNRMDKAERLRIMFPRRLKSAMFERNMTNKELAEKAGLNENMIGHYANGKYRPKMDALECLCNALGVSADYLMGRAENK